MYSEATRRAALALVATGASLNATSKLTGISRAALSDWLRQGTTPQLTVVCPRCDLSVPLDQESYAYLLGMYLGDGCISLMRRRVYCLRVTCCSAYPQIIDEVRTAMSAVRPGGKVCLVENVGCVNVVTYWKHWPCVFPQHGKGRKHERPIILADWQREIVERHPGRFLRGLFHSDGCRFTNWTTRTVAGRMKRYEYPRYMFSNCSTDIMGLCQWALDLLEIDWRMANDKNLSVARRAAVAKLDEHVGPKS